MPVRVKWEDQYALSYDTSAISAHDSATSGLFAATNDGIAGISPAGKCGFLLDDDHPSIDPGVSIETTRKTTGLSELSTGASAIGKELALTKKLPVFSPGAFGITPEKVEVLLWSLFQKGASESGSGPYVKNFIPYVQGQSEPEMFLSISRNIGDPSSATGYGHLLTGAIVSSFNVSGSQGARFIGGVEIQGRTFRKDYIHTSSVFDSEDTVDHVFLDYTWTLGGTTAKLQSFDLTIVNNVVPAYYGSLVPTGFTLHDIGVTGTFALAMSTTTLGDNTQIDNFVAGTDLLLVGTHSASAIVWSINMHYTGAAVDPAEVELLLNLPYEGVSDGTNHAIEIDVSSSIERSIPA